MKQPTFFEILRTFNEDELIRLKDFLNSPFFNTRKSLVKLFELSLKAIKSNNIDLISKKSISINIYRDENANDEKIRRLFSDFTVLLDKYLIQLEIESNTISQITFLAENLRKRALENRFRQKLNEAYEKLNHETTRNDEYYSSKFTLLQLQSEFEGEYSPNIRSTLDQEINDSIDNFFIMNKLFRYQVFYSNQYIHKEMQYNWTFFSDIRNFIEENINSIKQKHPEIFLRYKMLTLLLNPEKKSIIDECISYIDDIQKKNGIALDSYYIDILNLCSLMINLGDTGYDEKIVFISKNMKLNKVWDKSDFIHYKIAKIIIESAIIMKEFEWAKYFITFAADKIEPEFRRSFENLMLSKMYFFKGEYDNARFHQSKVHYEDFIFYTDAKGIEARIEYETNNYIKTIEAIESLKKYLISHKKIPDNWKISFAKFGDLLVSLIKCTEKKEMQIDICMEVNQMKDKINTLCPFIYGKEWLLSKYEQLLN